MKRDKIVIVVLFSDKCCILIEVCFQRLLERISGLRLIAQHNFIDPFDFFFDIRILLKEQQQFGSLYRTGGSVEISWNVFLIILPVDLSAFHNFSAVLQMTRSRLPM
ncbi:hypothetical protein DSECCO2_336770 [anaerobic digester metagenome]